jgi:hypothetical protein
MFLLNRGYRRTISEPIDRIQGSILLPYGNVSEKLLRMPPEYQRVLVDPQLYLAALPAADCEKACARLATYPWFGIADVPDFDSGEQGLREWEQRIREQVQRLWPGRAPRGGAAVRAASAAAVEFQLRMRVSYVILPSPLITEREDEGQTQADWLDAGLRATAALEVERPVLATVALHQGTINDAAFQPAGFLDTIIDQVAARGDDVGGVYIVVAQDGGAGHPFDTDRNVLRAYLHLVRAFADRSYEAIVTNFADVFGLVCLGAGATAVGSGPSHSLRRLSLAGFREASGGRPLPHFYSHPCIAEFLPESELSAVIARNRGALRRVRDITDFSEPLFEAMERGASAASVPAWAEGQNNVAEAQRHFVARFAAEAHTERRDHVRDWLEDAIATSLFLRNRFGTAARAGKYAPADHWLDLFDGPA